MPVIVAKQYNAIEHCLPYALRVCLSAFIHIPLANSCSYHRPARRVSISKRAVAKMRASRVARHHGAAALLLHIISHETYSINIMACAHIDGAQLLLLRHRAAAHNTFKRIMFKKMARLPLPCGLPCGGKRRPVTTHVADERYG